MKRTFLWALFVAAFGLLPAAIAARVQVRGDTEGVTVVYPREGQRIPYVTSSFAFGAVPRGSAVTVNGHRALVAAGGGWIAYVPFAPGDFVLHVVAKAVDTTYTFDRTVKVAEPLVATPARPASVDPAIGPEPAADVAVRPGDLVHLAVKASVGASVSATVPGVKKPVVLSQTPVASPSPAQSPPAFAAGPIIEPSVAGIYQADVRAGALAPPAKVTYSVTASGTTAMVTSKGTIAVESGPVRVGHIVPTKLDPASGTRPYGIVENSPNGDWLFYPPAGTPFEVIGRYGDSYRVALGTQRQAWVEKKWLELDPSGTAPPQAVVKDVNVGDDERASTITVHLSERVPFELDESLRGRSPTLHLQLYGTQGRDEVTHFDRPAGGKLFVSTIVEQSKPGQIAVINIAFAQRALWGYRAEWNGDNLVIVVKKPPHLAAAPDHAVRGLLVAIDPGHSPDSGAVGPLGTPERDVNLAIAKRLAAHLEALGARTLLTRTGPTPLALYDRPAIAAGANADILISVHNNALPDGVDPFVRRGYGVYWFRPQSLALARALHSAYAKDTNLRDDGLYHRNLALCRPTDQPSVLTESAYIMWPQEEELLLDPAFQDKLGFTMADGIERWAEQMRTEEP